MAMTQLVPGATDGRFGLGERDVTAGAVIELLVAGRWTAARVEYDASARRYYALLAQQPGDGGTLYVLLRLGTLARWPTRRGV